MPWRVALRGDAYADPVSARRKTVYACLGLAGLSLALYAGALYFDFINFDDQTVLLAHPDLYHATSLLVNSPPDLRRGLSA